MDERLKQDGTDEVAKFAASLITETVKKQAQGNLMENTVALPRSAPMFDVEPETGRMAQMNEESKAHPLQAFVDVIKDLSEDTVRLRTTEAHYADLLQRLGVQGHDGVL